MGTPIFTSTIRDKNVSPGLPPTGALTSRQALHPDGKRLVFASDRSGNPQIYLTDISGRPPVRLTYDGRYNTSPVWSPRADVIAFVGRSEGQRQTLDVYTIRADGSRLQRLQILALTTKHRPGRPMGVL